MDVIDQGMYCTLHIGGVVLSVCVCWNVYITTYMFVHVFVCHCVI